MRKCALLLVLLSPVLAACGSSSSSPTSPTAVATSTPILTPTPIPASALSAAITGIVTNAKTGKPVAGATLSLGNKANSARTDGTGHYRLAIPGGKTAAVFVSARGYSGALSMGKVAPHGLTTVDFKLNPRVPGQPDVPPFPGTFGKP